MNRDDVPFASESFESERSADSNNDGYVSGNVGHLSNVQVKLGTFVGDAASNQRDVGGVTNAGYQGEENEADAMPELPIGRKESTRKERSDSRNADYMIDVGVRERRTSSNIRYSVLPEERGSEADLSSSSKPPQLNKYASRWYIILVFSLANFWIGMSFSTWGPIAHSMEFVFPFQDSHIALLSSLGLIGFIPMFPVYNWIVQTKGLRIPMIVGTFTMALGGLLRCGTYFGVDLWWVLFVGQAIASLSVAIQGTLGASLVATWFPTEERVLATALITLTAPLGSAASSVIGPQIVRDNFEDVVTPDNCTEEIMRKYRSKLQCSELGPRISEAPIHNRHELHNDINIYLVSQMVLAVLIFILTLIYFPRRPPLPPSFSAAGDRLELRIGLAQMIRNRDFWCFCTLVSLPYGCFTGWIPLLEPNLRPLGYSQKEAGLLSFFALLIGAAMGIASGFVLNRLRRFIKMILILLLLLTGGMAAWFTLQSWQYLPHSTATLYTATIGLVVSLYILTTGGVDLLCEVSYPVPENLLMTSSQLIIVLIAIVFLVVTFIPGFVIGITSWILLGSIVITIPCTCIGRARLKRLELDSQHLSGSNKQAA